MTLKNHAILRLQKGSGSMTTLCFSLGIVQALIFSPNLQFFFTCFSTRINFHWK